MALKVNARIVGYGPDPSRTTALVAVIIEFGGPQETMEIKLLVPNETIRMPSPSKPWRGRRTLRAGSSISPTQRSVGNEDDIDR